MPKTLPMVDVSAPICCAPVSAGPMGDEAALQLALRLKALADPVRIKLMSILLTADGGEVCTCDLATGVGLAESTVSHHLGQLKKAGMVERTRRGMNVFYRAQAEALDALRVVLDPNCCVRP
ncbi:Rv2640c family ArsR-like transcriptional regulator [Rhodococcus sp. TAF43]|uniref:Rv2640c family ArsR-like transcriptional regulator n=1 Tax=unclassified Rhodococcus (in: high G+C Gram-positive bacteria) TaxID=192944 RepID=UPI000E0B8E56|nr:MULTISPECIES: Rv2640c family ArsR-like transcriptional regulator [unclassified Rhodococcus (in: high G+C Gram-positive bacteria)]QKT10254.1 helix-turn-helix transcriptional regulator [Rhodococcus sp. W8901]RDI30396.1 ArsR family transcriptional regulator [Rhodococcus sp. AG1013]